MFLVILPDAGAISTSAEFLYYIKVGCITVLGVYITWTCFLDVIIIVKAHYQNSLLVKRQIDNTLKIYVIFSTIYSV